MTLLNQIIDGASDGCTATSDLLRKIQVLAHRLDSVELKNWVSHELNGYPVEGVVPLPLYRGPLSSPVRGTYAGPGGARLVHVISEQGVPEGAVEVLFRASLTQPLAELERLASQDDDAGVEWSPRAIGHWNKWEDEELVPSFPWMNLFSAVKVLPRSVVLGVIDSIRNKALELALELQAEFPSAGTEGGPTVADLEVANTVWTVTNIIYGNGNSIGHGEGFNQSVRVGAGDLPAFVAAVTELGLGIKDVEELAEIVSSVASPERVSRLRQFGERIADGAVALTGNVAANVVATQLLQAARQYLNLI
ncbi:hypothetical protein [Cryobacterium shii]|uniref:AbiTii domain-containing protein n=1 Tax=Cryobacterium shii TaxID=1259235 RepID=A0AAQ2C6Q8_9MICO|nr:hypothetical protein [Cryobacterium shii]TFC48922.1 hypothetical protein E3O49_06850 [Cryobacterium shii]